MKSSLATKIDEEHASALPNRQKTLNISFVSKNVKLINSFGSFGAGIGQFKNPWGIAVSPASEIYVADTFNNRVQKFNSSGVHLETIGSVGSSDGYFDTPYDVDVDAQGNLFVADNSNYRVQVFDSFGAHKLSFGSIGRDEGEFFGLSGIAVSEAGVIFTAEALGSRVQAFRPDGALITTFGTYGEGVEQFRQPKGIAVSNDNRIYVTDEELGRVQILQFHPDVPEAPILERITVSDSQVALSFSGTGFNGGAVISGFSATCDGVTQTGVSSPIVVSGLTNGTEYACSVKALNSAGESPESNVVFGTPAKPPEPPVITSVEEGDGELFVRFSAGRDGGATIDEYVVTCGTETVVSDRSPVLVTSLTNDVEYRCSVVASNSIGTSLPSDLVQAKPQETLQGLNLMLIKAVLDARRP